MKYKWILFGVGSVVAVVLCKILAYLCEVIKKTATG